MIKAILFDNFGVISSVAYWSEVEAIEVANGNEAVLSGLIDNMNLGKIAWNTFCSSVAADLGISEQEVENCYSRYSLNRQVIALATRLKERFVVALASNAHHEYLDSLLKATSLDMLFDPIFISSEIGVMKPDPEFYLHTLEVLGLRAEECVMIDDSYRNIEGAEAVGMKGIVFTDAVQLEHDLEAYY